MVREVRPPRRILATILFGLAALRGQESEVKARIAAAEAALARKQGELAALELAAARQRLPAVADETLRGEFEARLAALAAKADPVSPTAQTAAQQAAQKLLAVARLYEEKGWLQTALEFAEQAAHVAPAAAGAALTALRAKIAAAAPAPVVTAAASGPALKTWFGDGEASDGSQGWQCDDEHLGAPALPSTRVQATFLSALRARPESLSFAADIRSAGTGGAGLIFGYRHREDYFAIHVMPAKGKVWLGIVRHRDGSNKVLAEKWGDLPPVLRASVTVKSNVVEARVGNAVAKVELTEPLAAGFLGVQAWNTGDDSFRPSFSGLAIEAEVRR